MISDFVLSDFSINEQEKLDNLIAKSAKASLELSNTNLATISSKYSQKNAQ